MLPRKLHLEQINRFHDKMEDLSNQIKNEPDSTKKGELAMGYFQLDKLWEKIDTFVEFTLKVELDSMDNK